MTNRPIRKKINLFYVNGEKRASDGILNRNAFDTVNDKVLDACKRRFAIFLYHSNTLKYTVARDKDWFYERLTDSSYGTLSQECIDEGVVAIYDGVSYITELHGILYSLKSFLDIFAFFLCGSIDISLKGMTFSSKNIDGQNLSGGNVINWLRSSAPSSFANREALAITIETHSRKWITKTVEYRDRLTHYGDLPGFLDMHVNVISHPIQNITKQSIVHPYMPDGIELLTYNDNLVINLVAFIEEAAKQLPFVKMGMLNFDVWTKYTGKGGIRIEEDR